MKKILVNDYKINSSIIDNLSPPSEAIINKRKVLKEKITRNKVILSCLSILSQKSLFIIKNKGLEINKNCLIYLTINENKLKSNNKKY